LLHLVGDLLEKKSLMFSHSNCCNKFNK